VPLALTPSARMTRLIHVNAVLSPDTAAFCTAHAANATPQARVVAHGHALIAR
jgi:hypothetical protein